ncbi:hypothetical protein L2E82_28896 [Cichorium intybus]|uniref:Uncharacterized protein n=1 Tax=Cichorium intybus TaxID=13427 RepID=A0ACB9CWN9_CICIN|nr:hypothetical protein L2E82_28896 [Cichorium intybus]
MDWESPADAMPWVGLYVSVASLVCTLAMAADAFHGFREWKLWFPCRFFTINAVSITLIAIAMKLPVDLTTDVSDGLDRTAKFLSIVFLVSMLANFLPSLGLMNDKELLMNIGALGILIITITVNVWIQISTTTPLTTPILILIMIFSLPWPFSVALTVSASRRILQRRYEDLHRLASNHHEINFSYKGLVCYIKKHWMMAETGNPQFVVACSPVSSALGVICSVLVCISVYFLIGLFSDTSNLRYGRSDYKWSINVIVTLQSIGTIVGSIAPIFRCLTATFQFNLSKKWSTNHLNVFRVEKHWIQILQHWKRCHVRSHIPGRHCKKAFHNIKNMVLNFCVALQIMVVIICNTVCLIPRSFLILLSCCFYFCKLSLKRFKQEPNASNGNVISDMDQEYTRYVLQVEVESKLLKRVLRNALKSINRLVHKSEEKEPSNLLKLLKKSTGFHGVLDFESDQIPSLHQEETKNCWSLVVVTLTAIALALPNIANSHVKELLSSMREGLEFVRHIEETLNTNGELVKARKAARRVWTDVEVYSRWLQIDLQKKSLENKTSQDILQWLGYEAIEIVIQFMRNKNGSLEHSLRKFIAANSMYRISQTILLHCYEQENWPNDEEIFEFISIMIADLLSACFTNLPRVITMKCHDDAIEKWEGSIRTAAQLLGKSKKIIKILKMRQLPNLDMDSMAYIDKWHALPKSQMPHLCSSDSSSSSNQSFVVTIV